MSLFGPEGLVVVAAGLAAAGVAAWPFRALLRASSGGWQVLARHYAHRGRFEGELRRFQSATLETERYPHCLTVGRGPDGLYLAAALPLPPLRPPLLVPWADVSDPVEQDGGPGVIWQEEFQFARTPEITLSVSPAIGRWILDGARLYHTSEAAGAGRPSAATGAYAPVARHPASSSSPARS